MQVTVLALGVARCGIHPSPLAVALGQLVAVVDAGGVRCWLCSSVSCVSVAVRSSTFGSSASVAAASVCRHARVRYIASY